MNSKLTHVLSAYLLSENKIKDETCFCTVCFSNHGLSSPVKPLTQTVKMTDPWVKSGHVLSKLLLSLVTTYKIMSCHNSQDHNLISHRR
jgi:hypothetical protein